MQPEGGVSVYKRDYLKELKKKPTGETVWAYAFCFRKQRYRADIQQIACGWIESPDAALAKNNARTSVREQVFSGQKPLF